MTGTPPSPTDPRWLAVRHRDAAQDGQFVFAVVTTGIYCRPSCASRPAKPENIRFFDTPAAAAAAGFRPCRRCRPDALSPDQDNAQRMTALCRLLDQADPIPSLADLAAGEGISPQHLLRRFKATVGMTPLAYARAARAERLRTALQDPARNTSVTDAFYDAGFGSSGRFYEQADRMLGMAPSQFRKGGQGETITYGLGQCWLGDILVAGGSRGICAILLGDAPAALVADLRARFPQARIEPAGEDFQDWMALAIALVDDPQTGRALPLDMRGTVFQHRVWQALLDIPPGQTTTYSDLAQGIGQPRAVRAVASAVAANPLAVAVPCHRVLRLDGQWTGYRWGIERKRALLRREGVKLE